MKQNNKTEYKYVVLLHLGNNRNKMQADIAQELNLSEWTVSRICVQLEALGLTEKIKVKNSNIINLTPSGRKAVKGVKYLQEVGLI